MNSPFAKVLNWKYGEKKTANYIKLICCREDELLGILVEKQNPEDGLAGKSTLNRLELTTDGKDRYKKVVVDEEAVERFFVRMYLESRRRAPRRGRPCDLRTRRTGRVERR